MSKKGLGRGLGALIPSSPENNLQQEVRELDIEQIHPNPNQPRQFFDEDKLQELALSIQEHGVVQPIIVRLDAKGNYEIVAGERRWRACQKLGMKKVPALVREISDLEISEIALIENIQREDLNPVEEAQAYKRLMEDFGLTQEQLSLKVGKSRSFIANIVRLLNLHPRIQALLAQGSLSAGHARPLLALPEQEKQMVVAEKVIHANLSVRQTEELVKSLTSREVNTPPAPKEHRNPLHLQIEEKIRSLLGTKVKIKDSGQGGRIEIEYYGPDDLQRIIDVVLKGDIY